MKIEVELSGDEIMTLVEAEARKLIAGIQGEYRFQSGMRLSIVPLVRSALKRISDLMAAYDNQPLASTCGAVTQAELDEALRASSNRSAN